MNGNYVQNGSSSLSTPYVTLTEEVPGSPLFLRFQQWFSFANDGDYGAVYIHPEGKEEGITPGGNIEKLVKQGYIVAAPDLLGSPD